MRRRAVLAAAAAALAIGVAGCGIPDETEARDLGAGPDPGYATAGGAGQGPPARGEATTKETFVANFLAAVAGEHDKAEERIRQYVVEGARDEVRVEKDAGLNLVRQRDVTFAEVSQGNWTVTLTVDQIGVLNSNGSVGAAVLKRTTYTMKISGTEDLGNWFVTQPPEDDPLLSTDALGAYYTPRTLYFWSTDRKTLVPDGRYMSNELEDGRQPTRIVEWLVAGPSEWVRPAVKPLSTGSVVRQNVPYPKDRLEVVLNPVAAQPDPDAPGVDMMDQLGKQLMWSLRPYLQNELNLQIEGQSPRPFTTDAAFYAANAANRATPAGQDEAPPERFALYNGKIHRLSGSPGGGTQPLPQLLLAQGVNERLVSAALARENTDGGQRTAAALVTRQGQQVQLRVASAIGDGAHVFDASAASLGMGRPVWLKAPMTAGLVVVDGKLFRFTLDQADLQRVPLPEGIDGRVTDVAAAPDGRRIAVVSGGRVYVLGISREGEESEKIEADEPARLVPTTLRNASAVDWSEETKVVVAGDRPNGKSAVWEVSLDGVLEEGQGNDASGRVTHLVAYPDDPVFASPTKATKVMYAREGAAYDLDGRNQVIEAGEVVGAPGEFDVKQVTAPFFLLD